VVARRHTDCLFASDRTGSWQIWHYEQASGQEKSTPVEGGGLLALEHPRATGLLVAGPDRDGIRFFDLTTGATTDVLDDLHEIDWSAWDATDAGIYFVRRGSANALLAFRPFDAPESLDLGPLGLRSM